MLIGLLTLELNIPDAMSLKAKRSVLNRIKDRVRNKFNVSISEIEDQDVWNYACLGVCIITNDQRFANQVLDKVVDLVEEMRDCDIADHSLEFMHLN